MLEQVIGLEHQYCILSTYTRSDLLRCSQWVYCWIQCRES